MAIKDALGSAAKKIKDTYKAGDDETTGLGAELKARAQGNKAAMDSLKPSAEPDKPVGKPSPMKPSQGPYGSGAGEKRINTSDMTKPLGQMPKMHKGGMVKKTGPHILLKGEAVLSKKDTKKMSALGGGQDQSGPSDAPDGMSIDKNDDNTFSINHRHNSEQGPEEPKRKTKFTARNVKHLVRHVKQHFGGGGQDDGMAEPSSFADGGVVKKGGMAQVHAGETVIPAGKEKPEHRYKLGEKNAQGLAAIPWKGDPAPVKNPDIYIGGSKPKAAPKPMRKYQPTPADRDRITESTSVV
jgi:hypothetical protein